MSAQAKVQGRERPVDPFWLAVHWSAPTRILYVEPDHEAFRMAGWTVTGPFVPQSVADALADALETAWIEAHKSHRAVNRRDVDCRMHPCPAIREVVDAYRAGGNTNEETG